MRLWSTQSGELIKTFEAHTARIKAIAVVQYGAHTYFVSASSDGTVHLWRMQLRLLLKLPVYLTLKFSDSEVDRPLSTVETNSRITSLCAMLDTPVPAPKRKAEGESADRTKKPSKETPSKNPTKHKNH